MRINLCQSMDMETFTSSSSSQAKNFTETISILVVDDDTTCLAIVAAMLKKWKYQVVTVKHPADALYTLRVKGQSFHLVVSDVHMPEMNGYELQQVIAQEFNLPVILMSADDDDGVMLKGLDCGAALFMVKPISPNDLRDLWQYASVKKDNKIEEIDGDQEKPVGSKSLDEISECALLVDGNRKTRKYCKRKSQKKDETNTEAESLSNGMTKKAKVVWTNALHNRFLEAIRCIGLERSVPKNILEFMKVPGLTRENVASHLQKYRIFLRRVSGVSHPIQPATDKNATGRTFGSGHAVGNPSFILNSSGELHRQNPEQQRALSFTQFLLKDQAPGSTTGNSSLTTLPSSKVSYSNTFTSLGFRQSHLLQNKCNPWRPSIDSISPLYRANRLGLRAGSNASQASMSQNTHGSSSTQMIGPLMPVSPGMLGNGLSNYSASSFGVNFQNKYNPIQNELPNFDHIGSNQGHKEFEAVAAPNSFADLNRLIDEVQAGYMSCLHVSENNNAGHQTQVLSSAGVASEKQLMSTLTFSRDIEQEPTMQTISPTLNCPTGVEENVPMFAPTHDTSTFNEMLGQVSYGFGDFRDFSIDKAKVPSPAQQNGGEDVAKSTLNSTGEQPDAYVPVFVQSTDEGGEKAGNTKDASTSQNNNTALHDDNLLETLLAFAQTGEDENLRDIFSRF